MVTEYLLIIRGREDKSSLRCLAVHVVFPVRSVLVIGIKGFQVFLVQAFKVFAQGFSGPAFRCNGLEYFDMQGA